MLEATYQINITNTKNSRLAETDFDNLKFGSIFSDHMFVAEYKDGAWNSGEIVPFGNMNFSPALSTLHYGQSIFEGLKAYKDAQGEILVFRPLSNYKRMMVSADRMCIPQFPEEMFVEGMKQLLQLDNAWIPEKEGSSLYIRPFLFASEEFLGIRPSAEYKFIIFTCPVGSYYSTPVKVKVEEHYTRAANGGVGTAKTAANYAASLYPAKLAQEQGYDQIAWTDALTHKYFEESGTMNIIFRKGNTVFTPELGDSVLNGVTRASVLQLARDWGYVVEERKVSVEEVEQYIKNNELNEVFGAGTAATIAHIVVMNINGIDYALPAPETREFSIRVLEELNELKHGRIADTRGWIMKI